MNKEITRPLKLSMLVKILFFIYLVLSFYIGVYYDAGLMQDGARYIVHYLNSGYFYVDTNTWRFGPILFQIPISIVRAIVPPELFIKICYKLFLVIYFIYPLLGLFWSYRILKSYNKMQYFSFALAAQLIAMGAAEYFYFVAINQAFLLFFPCLFHFIFAEEKKATIYFTLLVLILALMHQSYLLVTPIFLILIFLNKHKKNYKFLQCLSLLFFVGIQLYLSYIYISPSLTSSVDTTFNFAQWPFASSEMPWSKRGFSFLLSFTPLFFFKIFKGFKIKILFLLTTGVAIAVLLSDTYYGLYILESRMLICANLFILLIFLVWSIYKDNELPFVFTSILPFILIFKIVDIGFVGSNWIDRYDKIFSYYDESVKSNTCYMYRCFHEDFGVWDNEFIRHMPVLKERKYHLRNFKPMLAVHLDDNSCQSLAIRHPANLGHAGDSKEGTISYLHNLLKFNRDFVDRYTNFSGKFNLLDLLEKNQKIFVVGKHQALLQSVDSLNFDLPDSIFQALEIWVSPDGEYEFKTYSINSSETTEISTLDSLEFKLKLSEDSERVEIQTESELANLFTRSYPKVFSMRNESIQLHLINKNGHLRSWKKSGQCVYEVTDSIL